MAKSACGDFDIKMGTMFFLKYMQKLPRQTCLSFTVPFFVILEFVILYNVEPSGNIRRV